MNSGIRKLSSIYGMQNLENLKLPRKKNEKEMSRLKNLKWHFLVTVSFNVGFIEGNVEKTKITVGKK